MRINGSLSDLHAGDAQYHEDCFKKLTSKRNISASVCASVKVKLSPADLAFDHIAAKLSDDYTRLWNSVEIHELYREYMDPLPATSTQSDPDADTHDYSDRKELG